MGWDSGEYLDFLHAVICAYVIKIAIECVKKVHNIFPEITQNFIKVTYIAKEHTYFALVFRHKFNTTCNSVFDKFWD